MAILLRVVNETPGAAARARARRSIRRCRTGSQATARQGARAAHAVGGGCVGRARGHRHLGPRAALAQGGAAAAGCGVARRAATAHAGAVREQRLAGDDADPRAPAAPAPGSAGAHEERRRGVRHVSPARGRGAGRQRRARADARRGSRAGACRRACRCGPRGAASAGAARVGVHHARRGHRRLRDPRGRRRRRVEHDVPRDAPLARPRGHVQVRASGGLRRRRRRLRRRARRRDSHGAPRAPGDRAGLRRGAPSRRPVRRERDAEGPHARRARRRAGDLAGRRRPGARRTSPPRWRKRTRRASCIATCAPSRSPSIAGATASCATSALRAPAAARGS